MKITDNNIIDFFELLIDEQHAEIVKLRSSLLGEKIIEESEEIDSKWKAVVDNHSKYDGKLKLIILAEAPLSPKKYFYKNQGTFLDSLRALWDLKKNTSLPDVLLKNRILILDLYKYPISSEFYKKDKNLVLFDNNYVNEKLRILKSKKLIDDKTLFVFRYKELYKKRGLHKQSSLKNLNFVKESGQLVSLNCKEKPQKINSIIAEILNNNYS
jgi:hypothetical protein